MDDKIIIISPIYHDNITYVTNADVSIIDVNNDDAQIFTEAFPVVERDVVERENVTWRNCFYSYTRAMLTCCCTTIVCFVFFFFIGGADLFFN